MQFPIFPLNGAVFFPKTTLPLNIFEKRYIEMVDYSLANQRLMGMVQSKPDGKLFNIGCLGKIISFNETVDGRYLISLEGVNCFKINFELEKTSSFRSVDAKIIQNLSSDEEIKDVALLKKILDLYGDYVKKNNIKLDIKELECLELSQLIKFIAMVSPFSNTEKQMCLESSSTLDFVNKLISVLEINSSNVEENETIN